MAAGFAFELVLHRYGAMLVFRDGDARYAADPTNGTDGLGQFLTAVSMVVTGRLIGAACYLDGEPGGACVIDVRWQDTELTLDVEEDEESPGTAPKQVFHAAFQDVTTLGRAVLEAYDAVLDRYGAENWRAQWGHPFPQLERDVLAAWLRNEDFLGRYYARTHAVHEQLICHGRTMSLEIAAALGEPHDRVVDLLRDLERYGQLHLIEHRLNGTDLGLEIDVRRTTLLNVRRFREQYCPE